ISHVLFRKCKKGPVQNVLKLSKNNTFGVRFMALYLPHRKRSPATSRLRGKGDLTMTNYFTKLALVAVVGIAGSGFVAADEFDKKTVITTNETMQLPNTTLPAGTYVIKLTRSPDVNRN